MQSYRFLVAVIAYLAVVAGEYDDDFCKKHLGTVDSSEETGIMPSFYDNFYVFFEIKTTLVKVVIYEEDYYSQQSGIAYSNTRESSNGSQSWVNANTDEILIGPTGNSICVGSILKDSIIARLMGVIVNATGNVELASPEVALSWNKKSQKEAAYRGSGEARGIATLMWNVCSYNAETEITTFTEWHIVDPSAYMLPAVSKNVPSSSWPVLPVLAIVQGINKKDPLNPVEFRDRIDFTFFDTIQSNDPNFQIPTTMRCVSRPGVHVPLPSMPSYFKFKGEQISISYSSSQGMGSPDLLYTVEEYSQLGQIFIQDLISTPTDPNSGNDKSYARIINDYNTGLSFQIDLTSGQCSVHAIIDSVDSIKIAGGNIRMRNSTQFFDLDSKQYQYMGIHKMRGIDCDAWSAYFEDGQDDHQQNTLYTWYFANLQWLKTQGYIDPIAPLPVTLEMQQIGHYTQFNFYEFDTEDGMKIPDMSLCFDPTTTLNIEMFFSARYDKVVAPSIQDFKIALYSAIMAQTSLTSPLRVSKLDIQPASNDETVVRFKLLDLGMVPVQGAATVNKVVPNSKVYNDLLQTVNGGTFSVDVQSSSVGTGKVTVYARHGSMGLFKDGKFDGDSGSGYSAGAMAGIAFGTLFLGLVLGIAIIFAVRKIRIGGGSDISMNKLPESQS